MMYPGILGNAPVLIAAQPISRNPQPNALTPAKYRDSCQTGMHKAQEIQHKRFLQTNAYTRLYTNEGDSVNGVLKIACTRLAFESTIH